MKINLFYDTTEGITKFTTLESEYILFSGKLVIIPAGFESDGASIPRFWWARVQPISGLYLRAFLKHDYLYRNGVPGLDADGNVVKRITLSEEQLNGIDNLVLFRAKADRTVDVIATIPNEIEVS